MRNDSDEFWKRRSVFDSRRDSLEKINEFYQSWLSEGDFRAQIWSYRVTLAFLDIRFQRLNSEKNLHISCGECALFNCLPLWRNVGFNISQSDDKGLIELNAEKVGVIIKCEMLKIFMDVDPIYNTPK